MAGRISEASLKAVRDAASIVDVVGAAVALRPAGGGRLKGLCPFHDEKSPSFSVSPGSNLFYCFGCGEGGDVFSFVGKLDGLSFSESVERLADRFRIELTYEGGGTAARQETGKRQRLIEALRAAAEFYAEQLATPDARAGREFLSQRGFDRAAAERFGVGFAPGGWDALTRHLRGRGFGYEELLDAGLAKTGSRGTPIDRFHRRLLWPIRETTGEVVGFGARRLFDDDPISAKYLNTPETMLFKKSQLLYGADLARRAIAQRYQAVVVEGYTDVMACHLAGVETAVATCGTAFGEEHVALLRRLLRDDGGRASEIIFTFDGDAAGRRAAVKAMQFDQRFRTETYVAVDPDGRDPCELRQTADDGAVRELVAGREPLVEFVLRTTLESYEEILRRGQEQDRMTALQAVLPILAEVKDSVARPRYVARVAGRIGLEIEQVHAKLAELSGGSGPTAPKPRQRQPDDVAAAAEREVIKAALQRPGLAGPAFDALEPQHFTSESYRSLRESIAAAGGVCSATDTSAWIARVAAATTGDELRRMVTALAVEPLQYEGDGEEHYIASVVDRLQELHVARRIRDVKARVQRTNPVTEAEAFQRLFGELIALEERKRQLRERSLGPA